MVTCVKFSSNAISPFRRAINWLMTGMFVFAFGIACTSNPAIDVDVQMVSASWSDDGSIDVSFFLSNERDKRRAEPDPDFGLLLCEGGQRGCTMVDVSPVIYWGRSDVQSVVASRAELSRISWFVPFETGYTACIDHVVSGRNFFFCSPINVEAVSPTTTTVETTVPVTTTTLPPTTTEATTSTTSTTTTTTVAPTTTVSNPLQVTFSWQSNEGCPPNGLAGDLYVSGHTATPSFSASVAGLSVTSSYGWHSQLPFFRLDEWPTVPDGEHTVSYTVTDGTYSRSGSTTVIYACDT